MRAYIPMVADLFHIGHINMIKKVYDSGYEIIVGIFTDAEVETYRNTPVMTMEERVGAVKACRYVTDVISCAPVRIEESFLTHYNIDMVFHGHTPEEDHLYNRMFEVAIKLGKFTRTKRTNSISTNILINRIEHVGSNAIKVRVSSLYDALQAQQKKRTLRVIETHNGISGILGDTVSVSGNEFDALWSSSLTASVSKGKPDIEVVDTSMRLQLVRDTMEVTQKPLIYDADTGGQPEILRFTVRALEDMGVSACIIIKCGEQIVCLAPATTGRTSVLLRQNCRGNLARSNKKFMVIARTRR